MRYFSVCSGIGGFELGIIQAHYNKYARKCKESKQKERTQRRKRYPEKPGTLLYSRDKPPLCVGFSEIDKHAIKTYKEHFPEHKNYGDATKINPNELPDFDMLCGGFPCQAFSIAGKRMGFKDTRGTLFFEIARIAKAKKPQILFLENVKGLLSHDNGRTFACIIATLHELGYNAEWQVLNSKHFGVPQNRERVFIIGHLRGKGGRQIFPIRPTSKEPDKWASSLQHSGHSGGNYKGMNMIKYARKHQGQYYRIYDTEGISPTLAGASKKSGDCTPKIKAVLTPNRPEKRQSGRRFKEDGEEMFTLTGQDQHGIMIQNPKMNDYKEHKICPTITSSMYKEPMVVNRIRRLTPIECERLQGFPDNWTVGSDTQRYKQCGNAVTVNVIAAIAENLV